MIEWIIFIVIAIIISEILFFNFIKSDEWVFGKLISLFWGYLGSSILFGIPYFIAYGCNHDWVLSSYEIASDCVNHGIQVFFWYYGIMIGIILFFWINKKLLNYKDAKNKSKRKK